MSAKQKLGEEAVVGDKPFREVAGPQNIYSLVLPEASSKAPCALKGCDKCAYWPNPAPFNEKDSRERLRHIVVSQKTGHVTDVRHFRPRSDLPYNVAKADKCLDLAKLKPECIFEGESTALSLRSKPVGFWTLYRDRCQGQVVFCSRECVLECYTPPPEKPVYSDKGWDLTRELLRGAPEAELVPLARKCSEEDMNFREPVEGLSALHLAVRDKLSTDFVRVLLEGKAQVDLKNKSGYTALHYAAMNCGEDYRVIPWPQLRETRSDTMDLLWEFKCDLNSDTEFGRTPLILAAMNGNRQAVLWLIEHGCDRYRREYSGVAVDFNARDWAEKKGEAMLCMLFDDVEKAELRKDWAPGQPFIGRGAANDPDYRSSSEEEDPLARFANRRGGASSSSASSDAGGNNSRKNVSVPQVGAVPAAVIADKPAASSSSDQPGGSTSAAVAPSSDAPLVGDRTKNELAGPPGEQDAISEKNEARPEAQSAETASQISISSAASLEKTRRAMTSSAGSGGAGARRVGVGGGRR
ncbi:unnamed protein product [Amoebophrya sp. A25]|nr:unnamed protein product [Amoebophrya sp. A25]|eukprot:GSA25T00016677001.1